MIPPELLCRLDDACRFFAATRGDAEALADGERRVTHRELDQEVDCWARAFAAADWPEQSRIALYAEDSIDLVAATLGVMRAGHVFVLLNPRLVAAELRLILEDCAPKLLLMDAPRSAVFPELQAQCGAGLQGVVFGEFGPLGAPAFLAKAEASASPEAPRDPEALAGIHYTSGTTGRPKGVMLPHRSYYAIRKALAEAGDAWIGWQPNDRSLSAVPFFHIGGIWWVATALLSGARTQLLPRFEAPRVLDLLEQERITKVCMVPSMIALCLDDESITERRFPHLQTITYGGSKITKPLLLRAREHFRCQFAQIYGLTETGNTAVCLRDEDHRRGETSQPELLGSAGRPYPGVTIAIRGEDGAHKEPMEFGEIWIRSPANMIGYWNRPAETGAVLRDGFLATGDGGHIDPEGFVHLGDRLKDMIICAGENIFPAEIESVLAEHPGIRESAVIGRPHPRYCEEVIAVVVPNPGFKLRAKDVVDQLRGRLANFKLPREIHFKDALPRTPSGKVQKHLLRAEYSSPPPPSPEDFASP